MKFAKTFVLLSIVLFLRINVYSQNMLIPDIEACEGDTINATIVISSMDSIGAITLYISFDTASLKFISLTNINPLANGIIYNNMYTGPGNTGSQLGKVAISLIATSGPINFSSGTLADLTFEVLNGNSNLQFSSNCEIADYTSNILIVNYTNGSVIIPQNPVVVSQPILNIIDYQNALIYIQSQNASNKIWQFSTGNDWIDLQNNNDFQGVNTDTLKLKNFNSILNPVLFRCKLIGLCESVNSDSIAVTYTNILDNENILPILYPNPFTDKFYINCNSNSINNFKLYSIDACYYKEIKNTINNFLEINDFKDLQKGLYFIEILYSTSSNKTKTIRYKIIKN